MTFFDYAQKFIGRPYIWGGDGSAKCHGGFDCSGFVLEVLWAFGVYTGMDTTAQGLYAWAKKQKASKDPYFRRLFFGKDLKHITHVAIGSILNTNLMIEAGGGDSKCKTPETSTGMVRIRPLRKDLVADIRL